MAGLMIGNVVFTIAKTPYFGRLDLKPSIPNLSLFVRPRQVIEEVECGARRGIVFEIGRDIAK
jgi:hypothetical protein